VNRGLLAAAGSRRIKRGDSNRKSKLLRSKS
jgi:hypothetical protein